jgi:hypothetical protein
MTFTVHWAYQSVGANEKLNPTPQSRNLTVSRGWTRIDAANRDEAVRTFELAFPADRVEAVT